MKLLDGSASDSAQPPSYQSPREGSETLPTSTPLISGSLPDALSRERARLLDQKRKVEKALNELECLVAGSDFQKVDRWQPAFDLVKAQLLGAMDLLEKIGPLDAQCKNIHHQIDAAGIQLLTPIILDEDRLEGFSDDGHHPCQ